MKPNIPDQAEKLRQLARQDSAPPLEKGPAAGVIEPDEPSSLHSPNAEPASETPETATDLSPEPSRPSAASPARIDIPEGAKPAAPEAEPEAKEIKPFPLKHISREDLEKKPEPVLAVPPVPPGKVDEEAVAQLLTAKRFPLEGKTRVIAITGGKGGVGKSNLTCNLGIAMAQMKKRVLILDADLSLANIDVLLGLTPRVNLSHMLRGEKTLSEIIITGPEGIRIIPGGSGLEELANLNEEQMSRLFEAFAALDPIPDVLLIDTAAGIHPNVMQFLLAADQIVVVTTPEPTAYTDAYALIKTLIRHDATREIGVVVNMAKDRNEAMEVVKLMFNMCRQFLNIMFSNLGYIPRDVEVLKAVRHQKPLLVTAPGSPAAKEIRSIASTILQVEKKNNRQGLRGFFHRLFAPKAAGTGK